MQQPWEGLRMWIRVGVFCVAGWVACSLGARAVIDTSAAEQAASSDSLTSFAAAPATAASSQAAVVVWQQFDTNVSNTNGWDIFARRYDSSGNPLLPILAVTPLALGCQRNPAVAVDPAGNFFIVWESESTAIMGSFFLANGTAVGAPIQINATAGDATHRKMLPTVAAYPAAPIPGSPNGTPSSFMVAWQSEGQDSLGDFGIFGRMVSVPIAGSTIGQPVVVGGADIAINQTTPGAQESPAVAFAPAFRTYAGYAAGRFVATWQSDGNAVPGIYRRLFTVAGAADGGEAQVSTTGALTAEPAIAADASGNYTVAWRQARTDGGMDVRFRRFPVGSETSASVNANRRRTRPSVAAIGSGDFAVSWDSEPQDVDGRGVYATFLDMTALPVSTELVMNSTTAGDQEAPGASALYGGTFLTAWQSAIPGMNTGIRTRLVTAASNYFTVAPCRVVDTRNADGPLGGPILSPPNPRAFTLAGSCGIPANAKALSLNLTIVSPGAGGDLVAYPGPATAPVVETTTVSFGTGITRANNAVLQLAADGSGTLTVKLLSSGNAHLTIDVNGYFQ